MPSVVIGPPPLSLGGLMVIVFIPISNAQQAIINKVQETFFIDIHPIC